MKRRSTLALFAWTMLLGCKGDKAPYDHAAEHAPGHDHHQEDHGHGSNAVVRITRWSDAFELFAEHPPAIAGQEISILAHLTVLDGFRPLEQGELALELNGPAILRAETSEAVRPGIFRFSLAPPTPGEYRGRLVARGAVAGAIEGIDLHVFADAQQASGAGGDADESGLIEFLKEQQWGVPFATAFATEGRLAASIQVAGIVETPPNGSAEVGAPVPGRIESPAQGLPRPGAAVRKGQLLASLLPSPSSPEEAARANFAVAEAEARRAAARVALERAERLIRDEAIPQRELEEARREAQLAEEAVRAARRAAELFSGASAGEGGGSWQLLAPIDGVLAQVRATPGAPVVPGEMLFRIVDERELWIRARVPEQDAARLRIDRGAHYQIPGLSRWAPIDVAGAGATASVVTVGRTVDAVSRTVDVIFALHDADPALRIGGRVLVELPVGEDFAGVVVPRPAILDDEGRHIVYVQVDGEHFEERLVRLATTSGDLIGVERGLRAGERVVTRGAHLVRLASRQGSREPHGHVH